MKISRILHPTDFSDFSSAAMEYAKDIAKHNDAELTLVYVIDDIAKAHGWYVPHISLNEFYKEMQEQAEKKLEHCCYEHLRDYKNVTRVVLRGVPDAEIVKYANANDIDLIIMGTYAKSGMALIFHSTVEKVIRNAKCSVLCVKSANADSV